MKLVKFLVKGVIRDRSRSLFPVLMVSTGVFLTVLLYSWMNGVIGDLVNTNAKFSAGHVRIMTNAYKNLESQLPNDLSIINSDDVLEKAKAIKTKEEMIWVSRIRFGGLLDVPDENNNTRVQGPVMGLGIDLFNKDSKEFKILGLKESLVEGKFPETKNEILMTEGFRKKLNVNLNDTVTLLTSTMYGSMSIYNFKVVGILNFNIPPIDRGTIVVDISDVRAALDMKNSASEILGYRKSMLYIAEDLEALKKEYNEKHFDLNDEFSPIMITLGEQNDLKEYLGYAENMGAIMVAIFMSAMFIVLWNSGLLNSLRRYSEIGLRLALGEPKGSLYRSLIYESLVIGFIGSMIGTFIGLCLAYYMQYHPFNFAEMMKKSDFIISGEMSARVTFVSYYIGFIPGLLAPVLGTMASGIGIYKRKTAELFRELELEM